MCGGFMIYQLTPEQIENYKSLGRKVNWMMMVIVVGMLVVISFRSFSQIEQNLPKLLLLWGITLTLAFIGMFVAVAQRRKKQVTQVQTKAKTFILTSELNQEEIGADSIGQLIVNAGPSRSVNLILVKTLQPPHIILKGYDNMERLASDLEKIVSDPAKVVRNQAGVGAPKKARRLLLVLGIAGLVLLVMGGLLWVFAKLGLGFLAMPLCFVSMGASRFIGNRRNRNERMTGVGFIFLGIVWAVVQFFGIYMESGK